MKRNILAVVVLLTGLTLSGNCFNFKQEILNSNPEMLKALRVNLTEIHKQNKEKGYVFVDWNTEDNWNVDDSILNAWPVIPSNYYIAYITAKMPINVYLCIDYQCNTRIAKINTPQYESGMLMIAPPLPWVMDSERNLCIYYEFQSESYSLTFNLPQELYYTNTGVSVDGRELLAINSGDYYIGVFQDYNGSEVIYDSKMFSVSNTVGVNNYLNDKVKVNYVNDRIEVDSQIDNADFNLYSLEGKLLNKGKLVVGKTYINVSNKATGVYLVNIKGKNFKFTKKVLVK